jgi:HSP20 family protein
MMTWYVSPYRRIPSKPRFVAKTMASEEIKGNEKILPVDVKAVDDAFLISALLPGIEADDIDVQILDKTVSIRGNIEKHLDNEDSKILVSELPFGHFSRVLTLPTKLDPAEAVANLKDGVFTLRVPKAEEVRPKVINITAE